MQKHSYSFEAIGTLFEIVTLGGDLSDEVKKEVQTTINQFDHYFSRFRDDSTVSEMARQAGTYTLPEGSEPLFELYETLNMLTDGKVNPLVGSSLEALGYGKDYSFIATTPVIPPEYKRVMKRSGRTLSITKPVVLDIGAAGKGFLIDCLGRILDRHSVPSYVIDGSGDIMHKGEDAEKVGLEDPLHLGAVIGEVPFQNKALCASAVNRRAWADGVHHIINPETGTSTNDVIATWVIADDALTADGLATALFFAEPEVLNTQYTYEYMRIRSNRRIDFSPGFKNALY